MSWNSELGALRWVKTSPRSPNRLRIACGSSNLSYSSSQGSGLTGFSMAEPMISSTGRSRSSSLRAITRSVLTKRSLSALAASISSAREATRPLRLCGFISPDSFALSLASRSRSPVLRQIVCRDTPTASANAAADRGAPWTPRSALSSRVSAFRSHEALEELRRFGPGLALVCGFDCFDFEPSGVLGIQTQCVITSANHVAHEYHMLIESLVGISFSLEIRPEVA